MAKQNTSSGLDNQHWTLTETSTGTGIYNITNRYSGQLLEIGEASHNLGATSNQWPADNNAKQQWTITYVGDGKYKLKNVNSQLLLEIGGGSTADGATAAQWSDNGSTDNQLWYLGRFAQNRTAGSDLLASTNAATEQSNNLSLYPNPATTTLQVLLKGGIKVSSVTITDLRGTKGANTSAVNGQVDISTLTSGVYLVTVGDGKQEYHQKFVKQ